MLKVLFIWIQHLEKQVGVKTYRNLLYILWTSQRYLYWVEAVPDEARQLLVVTASDHSMTWNLGKVAGLKLVQGLSGVISAQQLIAVPFIVWKRFTTGILEFFFVCFNLTVSNKQCNYPHTDKLTLWFSKGVVCSYGYQLGSENLICVFESKCNVKLKIPW